MAGTDRLLPRSGRRLPLWLPLLALLFAPACSFAPKKEPSPAPTGRAADLARTPDAVPRVEPRSKYGNMKTYEVFGKRYYVLNSSKGFKQKGIASWYGKKFHGRKTSSGEIYDMYAMTAAHKTLPLPTYVEVKNLSNGKKAVVRVNDRGPFHDNRIIDLSYTAALKLGLAQAGTGLVEVRAIDPRSYSRGGAPTRSGGRPAKRERSDFYIQVGAFANYDSAKKLKSKLAPLKQRIRIARAKVNRNTLYRVQIGPLRSIEKADDIASRLGRFGIRNHRITLE